MLFTIFKYLQDPTFITFCGIVITGLITALIYIVNYRTFKLYYRKPIFKIKAICILPPSPGSIGEHIFRSFIAVEIFNLSFFDNRICKYRLTRAYWHTLITQGEIDFSLPKSSRETLEINLDYSKVEEYRDKRVRLTLIDLKGNKTRSKCFPLISDPVSAYIAQKRSSTKPKP